MNEENNNIENEQKINEENISQEQNTYTENSKKGNSEILKFILIIAAIFLGTFAAVYTIVDMTMYRLGIKPFINIAKQFDRVFDDDMKYLERTSPAPIKIETKDDKYIITVNLKSFDNNPENIEITTTSNGIKINGFYKKDDKNSIKENSFYQNIVFPYTIQKDKVIKEKKGNKLVITLPYDD
ncbi:Hsp20/alpha crystallin family protein [bacterium]|nr:Hsp20/alpha crystallin family protein [bacterium]